VSEKKIITIFTFLFIGIIVLGIMNINLSNHINNIENYMQLINANMSNVVNGMYPTNSDILDKVDSINHQIIENGKLCFNETTQINGYDTSTSSANVEVSFSLKQFSSEDEVYVTAVDTSGSSYEFKTLPSGMGRFTATMSLPLQENYTLSFTAKGVTNTSDSLPDLSLADTLCGRFKYNLGTNQTYSSNQSQTMRLTPQFSNDNQGNSELKVNEISLTVESASKIIGSWDLSSYLKDDGITQVLYSDSQQQIQSGSGSAPTELRPDLNLPALHNVIEFAMPAAGAEVRLSIVDNLGIHYEETDQINAGGVTYSTAVGSDVYQAIPVNGVNSGSSIHILK